MEGANELSAKITPSTERIEEDRPFRPGDLDRDGVDREVPPGEIVLDRPGAHARQRGRLFVLFGPRRREVKAVTLRKGEHGGAETAMKTGCRGKLGREPPREVERVPFDDEVDVPDRTSQQKVPDGAAHEIQSNSARAREPAGFGDSARDVGGKRAGAGRDVTRRGSGRSPHP